MLNLWGTNVRSVVITYRKVDKFASDAKRKENRNNGNQRNQESTC